MQTAQQEWSLLQSQAEKYEFYALMLKMLAILCAAGWIWGEHSLWLILIVCCYVQEAIGKTMQSRLVTRLEQLEVIIREGQSGQGMQLNSQWRQQRPGMVGQIRDYASNAVRPTVAFPYLPLLLCLLWVTFYPVALF